MMSSLTDITTETTTATVFQVVAYNLRRAREERGMTQRAFGEAMEVVTGTRWSVMMVSQAEGGWSSQPAKRVRHFDASDLVAFALVLRVPVPWFFLPPPAQTTGYPPSSREDAWITTGRQDAGLSVNALASLAVVQSDDLPVDDLYLPRLRSELPEYASDRAPRLDARTKKFIWAVRGALDDLETGED